MKSLIIILLAFSVQTAFASFVPKKCSTKAESSLKTHLEGQNYDKDGFHAFACSLAPNKAVVICQVSASKGDGAATDTYQVVLNKSCTRFFRIDLIGEE